MADELAAVQSGKDADFLGANNNDGVLRTGSGLSYTPGTDGGNEQHVTLDWDSAGNGAANKVAFWSDDHTVTSDDNLHWDSTNNRLGVGTSQSAVYATLHVLKTGSPIAPTSLSVVGIFQNDNSASDNSEVHIASGTSGKAAVHFGDSHDTSEARISYDNPNDELEITAGKVGIGVSSPNEKLEVSGKVRTNDKFNVSGTDGITQVVTITDASGTHTLTFTGGILTGYTLR